MTGRSASSVGEECDGLCAGGGDENACSGEVGDNGRSAGGEDDRCVGGGGDGVAVRSPTGGAPMFFLLRLRSLRSDLLDPVGRFEVDASDGLRSVLAFFLGGVESDAESSSTTSSFLRDGTGGTSTTGFGNLDLTVDFTSFFRGFSVCAAVLPFIVLSTLPSCNGFFPFPPLEYLHRFFRRAHT